MVMSFPHIVHMPANCTEWEHGSSISATSTLSNTTSQPYPSYPTALVLDVLVRCNDGALLDLPCGQAPLDR